jgi:hypothetical protein
VADGALAPEGQWVTTEGREEILPAPFSWGDEGDRPGCSTPIQVTPSRR